MGLIIPTLEESEQMKRERMDIIDSIMHIQNVRKLHILAVMARKYYADDIYDLPLPLNDFVEMLDLPIIVKMMDLFKEEDSKLWVNRQIKELLSNAIDKYTGIEQDS